MATKNTIIERLNAAGYKNTGTNRERAIRNLNLLIDAGILDIVLVPCEQYNSIENAKAFLAKTNDGKLVPSAYQIKLYGKYFSGHIMFTRKTRKICTRVLMSGERVYETVTDVINHKVIQISEIQNRVARLISKIKKGEDFMSPKFMAARGACSCAKCDGVGILPQFAYYAEGICFDCGGSGINRSELRSLIKDAITQ